MFDEPVVWDGRGNIQFLADHSHVHDSEGYCLKRRDAPTCDDPYWKRREVTLRVLAEHGYADSDTYGQCFCDEVHADSGDMAEHILKKMEEAGIYV